jgi:hypothetical protein
MWVDHWFRMREPVIYELNRKNINEINLQQKPHRKYTKINSHLWSYGRFHL